MDAAIQSKDKRIAELAQKLSQVQVVADKGKGLSATLAVKEAAIKVKDKRIAELAQKSGQVQVVAEKEKMQVVIDWEEDGFSPLRVTVAHHPRYDSLGAFALPTVLLLAITHRWGWGMEILPYEGSDGQSKLKLVFARGAALNNTAYSMQDSNHRQGHSPTELNAEVYNNLGFFPDQPHPAANISEWTGVHQLPAPGEAALHEACSKNPIRGNGFVHCRLIFRYCSDTGPMQKHILAHGVMDDFFTPSFRELVLKRFMEKNAHRVTLFSNSSDYNIAIHVRRGDISRELFPDRWTEQSTFAALARHICKKHPTANIHVFSVGRTEEDWTTLKQVKDTCGSVAIHLDGFEFDVWAHFVAADAFVMSRSAFSYVPALIAGGDIYSPYWGHRPLDHWHVFDSNHGNIVK
jgi:hypothetical protein